MTTHTFTAANGRKYLVRHTTREAKAMISGIGYRLDINTLERQAADKLAMNDIARVSFRLAQPIFPDRYERNRATGAFVEQQTDIVAAP